MTERRIIDDLVERAFDCVSGELIDPDDDEEDNDCDHCRWGCIFSATRQREENGIAGYTCESCDNWYEPYLVRVVQDEVNGTCRVVRLYPSEIQRKVITEQLRSVICAAIGFGGAVLSTDKGG